MQKLVAFCLLLTFSFPALAVEDGQVRRTRLWSLNTPATKLAIPYDSIQSFEYSKEVTRHLGVLPAIGVGMLKMRRHQHFFRISYRDSNHVEQVAVLEVPKHMPRILKAVLETRASGTCRPCAGTN